MCRECIAYAVHVYALSGLVSEGWVGGMVTVVGVLVQFIHLLF